MDTTTKRRLMKAGWILLAIVLIAFPIITVSISFKLATGWGQ